MSVTPLLLCKNVRSHRFVTVAAIAMLAGQSTAASSTRYVNAAATGGNNGKTWNNSYTSLQDALAEASDPGNGITQIWVAAGTYLPDGGR